MLLYISNLTIWTNKRKTHIQTLFLKNLHPHHWWTNCNIITRAITKHFTNICSSKLSWPTLTAKTLPGESCLALPPSVLRVSVALQQSKLVLEAETKIKFTLNRVMRNVSSGAKKKKKKVQNLSWRCFSINPFALFPYFIDLKQILN